MVAGPRSEQGKEKKRMVPMKNQEIDGYGGEEKKKRVTVKKKRKEENGPGKRKKKKKKKRREGKRKRKKRKISGPNSSLKQGRTIKIMRLPNYPLTQI